MNGLCFVLPLVNSLKKKNYFISFLSFLFLYGNLIKNELFQRIFNLILCILIMFCLIKKFKENVVLEFECFAMIFTLINIIIFIYFIFVNFEIGVLLIFEFYASFVLFMISELKHNAPIKIINKFKNVVKAA